MSLGLPAEIARLRRPERLVPSTGFHRIRPAAIRFGEMASAKMPSVAVMALATCGSAAYSTALEHALEHQNYTLGLT
jgi:hypothetical protein